MHIGSRTASRLGIPDALGQQTHRRSRSHRARARTDEPPQRTRFTHTAGLSVNSLIAEFLTYAPASSAKVFSEYRLPQSGGLLTSDLRSPLVFLSSPLPASSPASAAP